MVADLASGHELWSRSWPEWGWEADETFHPAVPRALFAFQDQLIAVIGAYLVSFGFRSGRRAWQVKASARHAAGDQLLDMQHDRCEARSVRNGRLVSKVRAKGSSNLPPTFDDIVFASSSHVFARASSMLFALDRRTGECVWSHHFNEGAYNQTRAFVIDGHFFFHSGTRLHCVLPTGGGPVKRRS